MIIRYEDLLNAFKKGLRNGNWRKLSRLEKALYRVTLVYAKIKRKIVNSNLVREILKILEKLRSSLASKVFNVGLERVRELLTLYERKGVFKWCPQLREWLLDPSYILWLGVNQYNNIISL